LTNDRTYRLGHDYRDRGSSSSEDDEFLAWINLDGRGIRNMGGVRPIAFHHLKVPTHAAIILVTHERSRGSASNPWEDLVDLPHGRIVYWGDAKRGTKSVDDYIGNRALRAAYDQVIDDNRALIPPILHFTKPTAGTVRFSGLCVLDRLELTWFEDRGHPVRNYRAHLTVLDQDEVDVSWIHHRMGATDLASLLGSGPVAWQRYQSGFIDRLRIWAASIRATRDQLPEEQSKDAAVLEQLTSMHPTKFEAATVAMFRELEDVQHTITRTRPTADGGFDFFGRFTLPPPLRYEIDFLGEAKKFNRGTAVTPKHVSRLVARLSRGQYGIFVTTSYFTKQAQEEVLADGYPTTLIAGADVVRMMRELRIARGDEISQTWLRAVESEFQERIGLSGKRA
jgi:hypothetical protein